MNDKAQIPINAPRLIMQVAINKNQQFMFGGDIKFLEDPVKALKVINGIIIWLIDIHKKKSRIIKPN